MDILVGLWSRDTKNLLSDNQGSRLYLLEQAITATQAKQKEVASAKDRNYEFNGEIRSIFVAPEYLFAAEGQSDSSARALSDIDRGALKQLLLEMSGRFPGMLIVPGTIIYRQVLSEFPISYAKKFESAKTVLQSARDNERAYPVGPGSSLSTQQKNEIIKQGDSVDKLIKNRMYVLLDGKLAFSYGKHADFVEAAGSDASGGVFVPGLKAGLKEIAGLWFGFEVCFDHQKGVLKHLAEQEGKSPDIQIICSAHVDNNPQNMVVRVGGFVLHASSEATLSKVFNKAPGVPTKKPFPLSPAVKASGDPRTQEAVIELGSASAGGSPLSTYVIRMPGPQAATTTQ